MYQARDPPWSNSDHFICALKMLANPRAGHDQVTEALRRVIEVDNDDAVRCGKLNREALNVIKRRFNLGQYSEAALCEDADLLTLRPAENGTQQSRSIALKS